MMKICIVAATLLLLLIINLADASSTSNQQLSFSSCSQSSTAYGGVCKRAIDGNTNQHYFKGKSCSHTAAKPNQLWRGYVAAKSVITSVRIYNRKDCCSDSLNNFVILVDGKQCASYESKSAFSDKIFKCNAAIGSVVTIRSKNSLSLTLCEVQVYGRKYEFSNVQQLSFSSCRQSSTVYGGVCKRAIDGNTNQHYHKGKSCSHTAAKPYQQWRGYLINKSVIRSIRIYNRKGCCSDRLNDFVILVDDVECASYNSKSAFSVKNFTCDAVGSVVTIRNRNSFPLTLCEVQVFGERYETGRENSWLSFSSCKQSSTSEGGVCERAIDGNTNQHYYKGKSCSHTADQANQQWRGYLTAKSLVRLVRIYNRKDCCGHRLNNFVILVDGVECASYKSMKTFSVKIFQCNAAGSVVTIRSRNIYNGLPLSLCEVQVAGDKYEIPYDRLSFSSCSQSSTAHGAVCERAIDGITSQHYFKSRSCTHTDTKPNQLWRGYLSAKAVITSVRIYNRQDCCSHRLNSFVILVDGTQCASYNSRDSFSDKTFPCMAEGRMVTIENRFATALTLCEVLVYGYAL